jgi:transposase
VRESALAVVTPLVTCGESRARDNAVAATEGFVGVDSRMTRGHSGWMALLLHPPHPRDLTDEQWNLIGPFLPKLHAEKTVEGARGERTVPCSVAFLWILRTGASWTDLPDRYPSYQTCQPPVSAVGPLERAAEHPRGPRPGTPRRRLSGFAGSVFVVGSFAPTKRRTD